MTCILGIDQSYTSTGCVILENNKFIKAVRIISNDTEDKVSRAWFIANEISLIIQNYNVKRVAIEGLAFGIRGNATRDLAGLQFIIMAVLRYITGINDIEIISPLSVKKFATGSGKAEKEKLIEALPPEIREEFDKLGVKKSTGLKDLTDAYWIARIINN